MTASAADDSSSASTSRAVSMNRRDCSLSSGFGLAVMGVSWVGLSVHCRLLVAFLHRNAKNPLNGNETSTIWFDGIPQGPDTGRRTDSGVLGLTVQVTGQTDH